MITLDFVKECLDILDLDYKELDDNSVVVIFSDKRCFDYAIATIIHVNPDNSALSFRSQALDYQPKGDLYAMANRHNCRSHMPACHINSDGEVIMDRIYNLDNEVSPHYILNNIIRPCVFLPIEAFVNFEYDDDHMRERIKKLNNPDQ